MSSSITYGLPVALACWFGVSASAFGDDRTAALERLVRQDCGSCHGMSLKGGLGPDLLASRLSSVSSQSLASIILDGVPGTPMPPWRGLLSEDDAIWIADYLKSEAK